MVEIYTDGSCDTNYKIGAWVAILLVETGTIVLSGTLTDTTHNRMELIAVIEALEHLQAHHPSISTIRIYSDSQYVINLTGRKEKLETAGFLSKKGTNLKNEDLLKHALNLFKTFTIEFIKVTAHKKRTETINFNIEADKLSRKIVREAVKAKGLPFTQVL